MDNEELKKELNEELCEYCPYKSWKIDRLCNMSCDGMYCDDALETFIEENEDYFDED